MIAAVRLAAMIGLVLAPVNFGPMAAEARVPTRVVSPSKVAYVGRVTDAADILAAGQRVALDRDLMRIQARTKAQIVVATVPTLGGRDIAGYARDLGNRWGIGDSARDDGIVIVLPADHQRGDAARIPRGAALRRTDQRCRRTERAPLTDFEPTPAKLPRCGMSGKVRKSALSYSPTIMATFAPDARLFGGVRHRLLLIVRHRYRFSRPFAAARGLLRLHHGSHARTWRSYVRKSLNINARPEKALCP
jgi:hypothetical protein